MCGQNTYQGTEDLNHKCDLLIRFHFLLYHPLHSQKIVSLVDDDDLNDNG